MEEVPPYELVRRENIRKNLEEMKACGIPDFNNLASKLVYGKNKAQEQQKDHDEPEDSDPEFAPVEEHERSEDEDDEHVHTSNAKAARSSHGKRQQIRTTIPTTSRMTRSQHQAEENSPPGHQTSKDSNSPEGAQEELENEQGQDADAVVISRGNSDQVTKKKHRLTMGHGLQDIIRRHGKMQIEFTEGKVRPQDPVHAAKLSSEFGIVVRGKMPIPLHWKELKEQEMQNVIPNAIKSVAGKFEMDRHDEVAKEVCTNILQKSIRQRRYRLKKEHFEGCTIEEVFARKPKNMTIENWTKFVNNFADERYQEICEKNKQNRSGVKHVQKLVHGLMWHVVTLLKKNTMMRNQIRLIFFRESHTSKKDGTMSDEALLAYNAVETLRRESQSEGAQPRTGVDIVQQVMKEKSTSSTYLATLGYSSASTRSTSSSSSARIHELEARLEQQEREARAASDRHDQELTARLEA